MKKLLMVVVMLLVASTASAMPIALNPDAISGFTAGSQTDVFDSIQFFSNTTSTPTLPTFTDVGNIAATSLLPLVTMNGDDLGGFGSTWGLVGSWGGANPLSGYVDASGYHYTDGKLNLYVTDHSYDWGSTVGSGDDTFSFDYWVATLDLVSGTGVAGSIELDWQFDSLLDGFWLDENGKALTTGDPLLLAFVHADTNNIVVDANGNILSDHDGSMELGTPVPEPASMVMFMTGLVGAALRRRLA